MNPALALTDSVTFADTFLKVLDKGADDGKPDVERKLVRLRFNPIQKRLLANRTRRNLELKPRQVGISTCLQADMFFEAVTRTTTTATLAHEDDTTQKLRRMVNRFYENMPENFRPRRHYSNDRLATYPDFDSEAVIATAGNTNTGRGGTYSRVHCSEFAFFKDPESILAGLLQGGNPVIDLESTPNGAQGMFYELCMAALDGDTRWTFHFFAWWEDSTYQLPLLQGERLTYTDEEVALVEKHRLTPEQINWRRDKQKELKHLFSQEYPEDPQTCFLLSGNGYFGDISHACRIAINSLSYDETHRYVAGLDFGQSNDYTVLSILDKTTFQQVEMLRLNKLAWAEMRRQIVDACQRWHVELLVAEENSIGAPNIEALQVDVPIQGFKTTNLSKAGIMAGLHEALHTHGLLLLDSAIQRDELQKMVSKQLPSGVWQIAGIGHDDTVIALALAVQATTEAVQVFFI